MFTRPSLLEIAALRFSGLRSTILGMIALLVGIAIVGPVASPACADSWEMPKTEQFRSANDRFRLTVTPAEIGSQLRYFENEAARERGKPAPEPGAAIARLEEKDGSSWKTVWIAPLRNPVAPVGAIIADDGRCVVTFDDWHGVGTGPNVVAIYGAEGRHISSLSLSDLVTAEYKTALPRSVSSISWSGERGFSEDGRNVLLKVLVPGHDDRRNADYVDVVVNLNDGSVLRPNTKNWVVALGKARAVNEANAQAERDRIRYLITPLIAPTTKDESAWHTYMREVFLRITPRFLDMPVASVTILREKSARDYKASEQWVMDKFKEEEEFGSGDGLMFATVGSPDNLVSVLRKAAGVVKNTSLKGSSIYVSIAADHRRAAAAAIASTGADFVWIDPAHAIAQRPERVPGSAEEKTAQEEMNRRQSKSFDAISKELQGKE